MDGPPYPAVSPRFAPGSLPRLCCSPRCLPTNTRLSTNALPKTRTRRRLLREEVTSGRLAAAESKAQVLGDLVERVRFDAGETLGGHGLAGGPGLAVCGRAHSDAGLLR